MRKSTVEMIAEQDKEADLTKRADVAWRTAKRRRKATPGERAELAREARRARGQR